MKRTITALAGVAAVALAPVVLTAPAHAADTVYFSVGSRNCAIAPDGTVGCDFGADPARLQYTFFPVLIPVNDIVIDQPWLPAHPTFSPGSRTLPGGNPSIYDVKTGDGAWGPYVEFAGARCEVGFHGSFGCKSKGRSWNEYSGIVSA
ncbi:hypothetical protein [Nocardia sp. XZ_19_385]|uniref:hypothetical protein n=1 Tax=Nocardia sp. XZ_19_385 TaxID=2769488 RepID=UPI00188F8210|nr:hypothetical protein [Nocardia sp. XZ_19_385]